MSPFFSRSLRLRVLRPSRSAARLVRYSSAAAPLPRHLISLIYYPILSLHEFKEVSKGLLSDCFKTILKLGLIEMDLKLRKSVNQLKILPIYCTAKSV